MSPDDNKNIEWKPLNDFDNKFEYREMEESEFRLATEFMHEKAAKDPNEYLSANQIARDNAWVLSDYETGDEFLVFKSTDIIAQKEGEEPIFGAIHDIHVEPVIVQIQDNKLQGTKNRALEKVGVSDIWPTVASARNSGDINFEKAGNAVTIEGLQQHINDGLILEDEKRAAIQKAKELETNFQQLNDSLGRFSVRKMSQSEVNSAQEWVSKKLDTNDPDFINENTVSNHNALVIRNDQTGEQAFVAHTVSIRQGEGGLEYGLPPGVNGMTVRAVTVPLTDGYPNMKGSLDDGIAVTEIPVDEFPKEVSVGVGFEPTTDEAFKAVQNASTIEGMKSLVIENQKGPEVEFRKHLVNEGESGIFSSLGDEENRFRARLVSAKEIKSFEGQYNKKEPLKGRHSYVKSTFDTEVFDKNPPYIIEDTMTGNQVLVATAAVMELDTDYYSNPKDVLMTVSPVVSRVEDGKLLTTKTEGLAALGLENDGSLKETRYTGKDLINGNTPKEMLESLSIKGMKDKIIQSQRLESDLDSKYKEKPVDERKIQAGPVTFLNRIDNKKYETIQHISELSDEIEGLRMNVVDDTDFNHQYEEADLIFDYTPETVQLIEKKEALRQGYRDELTDLVINPESFEITENGDVEKFDNIAASNALSQTKNNEYISLNTPDGTGYMAKHTVEDSSKVSVLKEGESIDKAVKLKNKADEGYVVLYSIKSKIDDYYDNRRITAEKYDAKDELVSIGEDAMQSVNLDRRSFSSMVKMKNQVPDPNNPLEHTPQSIEKDISAFNAQLSPAYLRREITHSQINKHIERVAEYQASPSKNPAKSELSALSTHHVFENLDEDLSSLKSLMRVEDSVRATELTHVELYELNIANGVYDKNRTPLDENKDAGLTNAVVLKTKTSSGGVATIIGGQAYYDKKGNLVENEQVYEKTYLIKNNDSNVFEIEQNPLFDYEAKNDRYLSIRDAESWNHEKDESLKQTHKYSEKIAIEPDGEVAGKFKGPSITAESALTTLVINGKNRAVELTDAIKAGPTGEPQDVHHRIDALERFEAEYSQDHCVENTQENEVENAVSNRRKLR